MKNISDERKLRLLTRAVQRHPEGISFCGVATRWDECFTVELGLLVLWYNVGKDSHAIKEKMNTQ